MERRHRLATLLPTTPFAWRSPDVVKMKEAPGWGGLSLFELSSRKETNQPTLLPLVGAELIQLSRVRLLAT